MQYTQEITLDVNNSSSFGTNVFAKEEDNESRFLKITMVKDGVKITPSTGDEAVFRCIKPDGHSVLNPATINQDGTITVELTGQVLAVSGKIITDIAIINDDQVLSTANFTIVCHKIPYSGDETESSTEFLYLIEKTHEAEAWAHGRDDFPETEEDNAKYWAEQAQEASEGIDDIRDEVIAAKNDAVSAKNTAVTAKTDAETAKTNAVQAKTDAVSAKNAAVSAQGDAEDARDDAEAWAHGRTDHPERASDNAKYWSEQAQAAVGLALVDDQTGLSYKLGVHAGGLYYEQILTN